MANTVTSTSQSPVDKKDYDAIQMLRDYMADNPDAPAFLSNYLINRLGDQMKWYDKKSAHFKNLWYRFRRTIIILSASIPFMVGLIGMSVGGWTSPPWLDFILKFAVGSAGVIIAVLEGLNQLYKSQEHYIDYRITTEQLKQEFSFFLGNGGKYEGLGKETSYAALISNCESIMASENNRWAKVARDNEKAAQSKDIQEAMVAFFNKYKEVNMRKPKKPKPDGKNPDDEQSEESKPDEKGPDEESE